MNDRYRITKVSLRNFRSLRKVDVTLPNPLFLVGKNNSGKSNFIAALDFLSQCMDRSISSVSDRMGGRNLFYKNGSDSRNLSSILGIRIELLSPDYLKKTHYSFVYYPYPLTIDKIDGNCAVMSRVCKEQLVVPQNQHFNYFDSDGLRYRSNINGLWEGRVLDSLLLPVLGLRGEFKEIYRFFLFMRFYSIVPDRLRVVSDNGNSEYLDRDGGNAAVVIHRIKETNAEKFERITEFLSALVPEISSIQTQIVGNKVFLSFGIQHSEGNITNFDASQMSDGTLRGLGLIVAVLQDPIPSLIVLEEPELYIHPGALDVLIDLIELASERTQVIISTHSPDILNAKWIQPEHLRIVTWENGSTHIDEIGAASKQSIQNYLMGAGELLRANALDPDEVAAIDESDEAASTDDLFEAIES